MSSVVCQMLADITGRTIETVNNTQEVGANGTALAVAAGIKGDDVLKLAKQLIKSNHSYRPNPQNMEVYRRSFEVFKKLYKSNSANFKRLNS